MADKFDPNKPMDIIDCYKRLDLQYGASREEVRKAYVELTQVWHPDRFSGNPLIHARARETMQAIEKAYRTLNSYAGKIEALNERTALSSSEKNRSDRETRPRLQATALKYMLTGGLVVAILVGVTYLSYRLLERSVHDVAQAPFAPANSSSKPSPN